MKYKPWLMSSQETNDPEGSLALARCLVGKQSDGELRLLVWGQEGWQSQSAAFTASEASNWLFRMSTTAADDWLVAALTTKEQFHEMLLDWLKQPAGKRKGDGKCAFVWNRMCFGH